MLLGFCTGVSRFAVLIKASFIDNAQRTVVIVLGMDALDAFRQQRDDMAITTDIVVITTLTESGNAAGNQGLYAERTVALGCGAMDYEESDRGVFKWSHRD
jgi:hypothetical protein